MVEGEWGSVVGKSEGAARGREKVCEELGKWRKGAQYNFFFLEQGCKCLMRDVSGRVM